MGYRGGLEDVRTRNNPFPCCKPIPSHSSSSQYALSGTKLHLVTTGTDISFATQVLTVGTTKDVNACNVLYYGLSSQDFAALRPNNISVQIFFKDEECHFEAYPFTSLVNAHPPLTKSNSH